LTIGGHVFLQMVVFGFYSTNTPLGFSSDIVGKELYRSFVFLINPRCTP
jgi:hypothetical protein